MLISLYLFYQLNPQISILSPQPMPFQSCQLNPTVLQPWKCSHFAQKQKIRELRVRPKLSEIPLFQGFFTYYFSTLDINATNSTWNEPIGLMSLVVFLTLRSREYVNGFLLIFENFYVHGNISNSKDILPKQFVSFCFLCY